jgi:hypothetical protein
VEEQPSLDECTIMFRRTDTQVEIEDTIPTST